MAGNGSRGDGAPSLNLCVRNGRSDRHLDARPRRATHPRSAGARASGASWSSSWRSGSRCACWRLGFNGLSYDESFTAMAARLPVGRLLRVPAHRRHAPAARLPAARAARARRRVRRGPATAVGGVLDRGPGPVRGVDARPRPRRSDRDRAPRRQFVPDPPRWGSADVRAARAPRDRRRDARRALVAAAGRAGTSWRSR